MSTLVTPGPWKVEFDSEVPERGAVYVEGPKGWRAEPIAACDFGPDVGVNEANASLIAAAPELLEALKDAEEMLSMHLIEANPLRVSIRAAISKAEGGAA